MLILTRNPNEKIIIGDNIIVEILEPKYPGTLQVRLGITAPREISVHREEVWERIHKKEPRA